MSIPPAPCIDKGAVIGKAARVMTRPPRAARFAFLDHPLPLAFAHRGGALEREENTLPAFAHAVALGYRFLETDVQTSRDGVAVIFHDDTLARIFGRPERMAELTWPELARLRTPGGAAPMRLEDLLEAFPDARINLDPKTDAAVEPMAEAIRRCAALDRVCVGSFDAGRTDRLRRLLGERLCWSPSHAGVARLWLAGWGLPLPAGEYPVVQVPPSFHGIPVVTRRFVAAAHARGVQVHVWTVDDTAAMERYLDLGVDGLMTDRPSLLRQVLERRGQWTGDPLA
jgi:glycerophosphoryl diester phosphodiesterase